MDDLAADEAEVLFHDGVPPRDGGPENEARARGGADESLNIEIAWVKGGPRDLQEEDYVMADIPSLEGLVSLLTVGVLEVKSRKCFGCGHPNACLLVLAYRTPFS